SAGCGTSQYRIQDPARDPCPRKRALGAGGPVHIWTSPGGNQQGKPRCWAGLFRAALPALARTQPLNACFSTFDRRWLRICGLFELGRLSAKSSLQEKLSYVSCPLQERDSGGVSPSGSRPKNAIGHRSLRRDALYSSQAALGRVSCS